MPRAWLLVFATALLADPPKLPDPYQSIVELAHAAPAEFAADALLRVVESGKIADRGARRDLIEQAFRLAAGAKFPVRMRGVPGSTVDTRSGYLSKAYDLKLDALSLQSRAVQDQLATDPAKARELFLEIPRPALAPLSCDDALVYDVSDFYRAAAAIANGAFSAKERGKEEHVNFLIDAIAQAASAAQLAPLAAMIRSVNVTPAQREILWNRLNGLLEGIQPDDRSFSAAFGELAQQASPEMQASFEKFRQKSAGCKDDARGPVLVNGDPEPSAVVTTPKVERYWQSGEARQLLQAANKLRFTSAGRPFSDAERSTREWQQQLAEFLSQMADWNATQEKSEADFYHQKCVVFEALIELIPQGPQRDTVLQAYVEFIAHSDLQQQSPVEWFMHAHSMLERVRSTNSGEPAKLLDAYQASGNPVLALYAALERTFSGRLPSWVTISN